MTRKVVQTGSSLAVTLPSEFVQLFKIKKGDDIEVTMHPQTGVITMRTGVQHLEGGKVTKRFTEASKRLLTRYDAAFRELAK